MALTLEDKNGIRDALQAYADRFKSRNKAANALKNVSPATVSNILNGKYENISDDMWRVIASQTGYEFRSGWRIADTRPFQEISYALDDARRWGNVTWVVGEAGCGKTTAARTYAGGHGEVFYILCSEDMKKGDFVREIARTVGIRAEGCNIRETWSLILDDIVKMQSPLLIFDEADKLTEPVFHYFISMYNKLEDKSGIVFMSTDYIKKRIGNGLRYMKAGYKEFYSRIGRKYFEVEETTAQDVAAVCVANGVSDRRTLDEIIRETEPCMFDLRRVKKSIHRKMRMNEGGRS